MQLTLEDRTDGSTHSIAARVVIGADGNQSAVRTQLLQASRA